VIASLGVEFPEKVSKEAAEIARLIREGNMDRAREMLRTAMGGTGMRETGDSGCKKGGE